MDEADRAQIRNEAHLAAALARRPRPLSGAVGQDPVECWVCGEDIPAARQKAVNGTLLCVGCQADLERRQRR